jgi:GrpB-like predicted nucleotidyltransferase (UPF0157 family)
MMKKICIEDYSPSWASEFRELQSVYHQHLGNLIIDIHHVGSTSIVGLASKPVIDIDVVIDDRKKMNFVIKKLTKLGYTHVGNQGITDREVFKISSNQTPSDGSLRVWQKHHLYVCPSDSLSLKNHLALRDALRNNPDKAKEYGELKKRLASEHPYSMDLYIEGKTPFITQILRNAGLDDISLKKIIQENTVNR